MVQDFNSTGSLLEMIVQEPQLRNQQIGAAVRKVEGRIGHLYGTGVEGKARFDHLRQRLIEYGGYAPELKRATAIGLKETINQRNGFDLDLINQIFIARFKDFEALVSSNFPAIFDVSHVNFLSEQPRLLRNGVVIYRNLSAIVNRGQRKLNGDYTTSQKGKADEQFREFRARSEIVMVGLEILLAERYNLEIIFGRFAKDPSYALYRESLSSFEELRDRIIHIARHIDVDSIRSIAQYLMALADHYASTINFQFLRNIKPDEIITGGMNLQEMQKASTVLGGRYVNSRSGFSQKLLGWLPTLDIAEFYHNDNLTNYFGNLKKAVTAQN